MQPAQNLFIYLGHVMMGTFCGQRKPVHTVGQGSVLYTADHR